MKKILNILQLVAAIILALIPKVSAKFVWRRNQKINDSKGVN